MATTDDLNMLGNPVIDLPTDIGDGQYSPSPSSLGAMPAAGNETFRRNEPFKDNLLTDNPLQGPSSHISIGRFHISDMLRPNSFRRVHQSFTHRPSPDLNGTFVIRFSGAGIAILRQKSHALVGGVGALANAALALDDGALIPTPTLYAQSTTFSIRLRMPGYEPSNMSGVVTPDPNCFDNHSNFGRRLLSANRIEEFTFGNSAGEHKVIPIPYPVGQSIPVAFDIVNHIPTHNIIVDFFVEIFIDRSEQNRREAADRNQSSRPPPPAVNSQVPVGRVSSARLPGVMGSIPTGTETNGLDVISDQNALNRKR